MNIKTIRQAFAQNQNIFRHQTVKFLLAEIDILENRVQNQEREIEKLLEEIDNLDRKAKQVEMSDGADKSSN